MSEINNNTINDNNTEEESVLVRPTRHHRREEKGRGKFFVLRNILNIIFIIGAAVGMLVYFFKNDEVGMIIVLGAMAFKMCECVIRLVK